MVQGSLMDSCLLVMMRMRIVEPLTQPLLISLALLSRDCWRALPACLHLLHNINGIDAIVCVWIYC